MREAYDEESCYCGRGSNTPTGKPYYCMKHIRWSDEAVPAEPPITPRYYYASLRYADFVIDDIGPTCSTWMVPGTYDAKADMPPPPVIATMFGYSFDVDRWLIQLGDQWYDASVLRMFAQSMDDQKVIYDDQYPPTRRPCDVVAPNGAA